MKKVTASKERVHLNSFKRKVLYYLFAVYHTGKQEKFLVRCFLSQSSIFKSCWNVPGLNQY